MKVINTILNFVRIFNRYQRPEFQFTSTSFGSWRDSVHEFYAPMPQPEENPLWISYQKLTPEFQALCQKPVPVVQNREPVITEPIDEPDLDKYKYSNEVPANLAFEAQGSEFTNEYLDAGQEGRYLREYCVQRNGANHFLHLKNLTDLRSVHQHQDPFYFAEVLDIPFDLAFQFAEAMKSLAFDRMRWLKLYHGNKKDIGLKDMSEDQRIELITEFIDIAEDLEKPDNVSGYPGTVTWNNYIHMTVSDEREFTVEYMRDLDKRIIQAALLDVNPHNSQHWDEDYVQFLPQDDNLDRKSSTNPYSTNRLYDGKDSLSWEFQRMVETASEAQLDQLKAAMKPSKRTGAELRKITKFFMEHYDTVPCGYSSRKKWVVWSEEPVSAVSTGLLWKRPKFHYFTSDRPKGEDMKSHFWTLYHARRKELREYTIPVSELSDDAKIALEWMNSLGKGNQACSIIYAASDGKSYNLYGLDISFHQKLSQHEINTLWSQYRAL